MTLHGCGRCGGVWLGPACAQRLAEALPKEAIELAARASSRASEAVDVSPSVRCPECALPMRRTRVAAAGLDLDLCESHGTWYDRHELEQVARTIAGAKRRRRGIAAAAAAGAVVAGAAVTGVAASAQQRQPGRQQEDEGTAELVIDGVLEGPGLVADGAEVVAEGAGSVAEGVVSVVGGAAEVVAEGAVAVVKGAFELIGAIFDGL